MSDSTHANSAYKNDEIVPVSFDEHVRKRPGMYFGELGGKGVVYLIKKLIIECIEICKSESLTFTTSVRNDNFSIEINGKIDLLPFLKGFDRPFTDFGSLFFARATSSVSKRLEISNDTIQALFVEGQWQFNNYNNNMPPQISATITCEIDETIFHDKNIDYLYLNRELITIPLVDRKTEIVTRDERKKYLNQNYYYFPDGIFYLFERIANIKENTDHQIKFEAVENENAYQIAITCRKWAGSITSFANYIETTCNGSLVDGVFEGIIKACRTYSKEAGLDSFKVTKKRILKNMIIVCAVKGRKFEYGGSMKQKLLSEIVRTQAKEIVFERTYNLLQNNAELRDSLIWHFDERNLFKFEL